MIYTTAPDMLARYDEREMIELTDLDLIAFQLPRLELKLDLRRQGGSTAKFIEDIFNVTP
ncbi:hypothetical protein BH10PSE16_BH10PSE16_05120 [soil metagenome]